MWPAECWVIDYGASLNGNKDNKASTNVAGDIVQDALILVFNYKSESWVIDSDASFHATAHKESQRLCTR